MLIGCRGSRSSYLLQSLEIIVDIVFYTLSVFALSRVDGLERISIIASLSI